MDTFELPKFKGVEEAIADVRAYGRTTGHEMLIGLWPNGQRLFESQGDEHEVRVPEEYRGAGKWGLLMVHCHPGMPSELSGPDLSCIMGMRAWGNLAACCEDETISWSRGYSCARDAFIFDCMILPEAHCIMKWVVSQIALGEGICNDAEFQKWNKSWTPEDDRYVALSHWTNKILLKKHYLRDYHLQLGKDAQRIVEAYRGRFKEGD